MRPLPTVEEVGRRWGVFYCWSRGRRRLEVFLFRRWWTIWGAWRKGAAS